MVKKARDFTPVSGQQHCLPCQHGSPKLTKAEINLFLAQHPAWSCIQDTQGDNIQKLQRTFQFQDFKSALHFSQQLGALAEQENHHPLLCTAWGEVVVTWWTHSINGLYHNDTIMASQSEILFNNMTRQST